MNTVWMWHTIIIKSAKNWVWMPAQRREAACSTICFCMTGENTAKRRETGCTPPPIQSHAYRNACKYFHLNKVEKEVITKHMWPVSVIPPRYPETYVICLTDKYCGSREIMDHYAKVLQNKYWGKPFAWFLKRIFEKVPRSDLLQEMLPELVSMERAASLDSSFAQQRSRRSSRWNHPSGRRPRRS